MPGRFVLRFSRVAGDAAWPDGYPAAVDLRPQLIGLLLEHAELTDLRGRRYVITPTVVGPGTTDDLEVRFSVGGDRVVPALQEGFERVRSSGANVRIGSTVARLAAVQRVPSPSVDQVLAADGARLVEVRFDTVTTFSSGDRRSRGVPDPALIVGSWASSWNGGKDGAPVAPGCPADELGERCPQETAIRLGNLLDPTAGCLRWDRVRLDARPLGREPHAPRSMWGFTGQLTLRLHRSATAEESRWLGRLAVLAPFVGTGYHVQLGLGATEVPSRAVRSAGPSEP